MIEIRRLYDHIDSAGVPLAEQIEDRLKLADGPTTGWAFTPARRRAPLDPARRVALALDLLALAAKRTAPALGPRSVYRCRSTTP